MCKNAYKLLCNENPVSNLRLCGFVNIEMIDSNACNQYFSHLTELTRLYIFQNVSTHRTLYWTRIMKIVLEKKLSTLERPAHSPDRN